MPLNILWQVGGTDGTHLKILSGDRDRDGRIYGQRAAEIMRKNGVMVPMYLTWPMEIDPQKSVQGQLAFIYGPVHSEDAMIELLKNQFSHTYEYTLVISDRRPTPIARRMAERRSSGVGLVSIPGDLGGKIVILGPAYTRTREKVPPKVFRDLCASACGRLP